ncbi:MAG: flagellin FliC [Nitrospinae bacterium]|nr:flagellin FliC [Nitrospinota bacterium]
MALTIFSNISSLNAQRYLETNRNLLSASIARVASGIRINSSSDDVAGLAISEALYSDVQTLKQGARNLNDGIALINTIDGALNEQASILIRLRELATQSATGTIGETERKTIQLEFDALRKELNRIAANTEFNGQKLIDGSLAASSTDSIILQIGLDSSSDSRIDLNEVLNITAVTSQALDFDNGSVLTSGDALAAIGKLNIALEEMNQIRGRVGANQNQLVRALNNLNVSIEGLTTALTTIRDADLALELAELTKNQILVQAGAAMIGQANLTPQGALTLLEQP